MADNNAQQVIDAFGRILPDLNMSLQQIQELVRAARTGTPEPVGEKKADNTELQAVMEKFVRDFKSAADEQKAHLDDVVKEMKRVKTNRQGKNQQKKDEKRQTEERQKQEGKSPEEIKMEQLKDVESLEAKFGRSYTRDQREKINMAIESYSIDKRMSREAAMRKIRDNEAVFKKIEEMSQNKNLQYKLAEQKDSQQRRSYDDITSKLYRINSLSREMSSSFQNITGLDVQKDLLGDLYSTEMKFTQEIRQAAYETAGVTKNSRSLQAAYTDIGKTVAETGVNRTEFQKSYLKALRSGVKDLKQAVNLTKTQLNAEKQLGLEAGSLQETFQEFVQAGGASENQLAAIGRGMRTVARNTGLTGDAMKRAVDGSKDLVKNLRNTGNLTAQSAKNMMQLVASSQKFDVQDEMSTIVKSLTNANALIDGSAGALEPLILTAAGSVGALDEAMDGTLGTTAEGMKRFGKGLESVLQQFGVSSFDEIDNLSKDMKAKINRSMKGAYNVELGQLRNIYLANKEASQTYAEKLADVNKELNKNITSEERKTLLEKKRNMELDVTMDALTALDEAAKGAKDMDQALAKFGQRRGDFEKDLSALGIAWTNETDVARKSIKGSLDKINEGLKEAGKETLKIDSSTIDEVLASKDPSKMRELLAELNKGQRELMTAEKAAADPMTNAALKLTELNDNIRNFTQKGIEAGFNMIDDTIGAGTIAVVGAIIGVGGTLLTIYGTAREILGTFKKAIGMDESASLGQKLKDLFKGKTRAEPGGGPETPKPPPAPPGRGEFTIDPATVKSIRRKEEKRIMEDEKLTKKEKKDLVNKVRQGEKTEWIIKMEEEVAKKAQAQVKGPTTAAPTPAAAAAEAAGPVTPEPKPPEAKKAALPPASPAAAATAAPAAPVTPAPEVPEDQTSQIKSLGDYMKTNAAAIAVLAVGALALGAVLVFLGDQFLKMTGFSVGRILEVGAVLGGIAAAVVAIGAAALALQEPMQKFGAIKFSDLADNLKKNGANIALFAGAAVLLGVALVMAGDFLLRKTGLEVGRVLEVAGMLGGLAAAVVAIGGAALELQEPMDRFGQMSIGKLLKNMVKGSIAITLIGGGIVLLGIGLIKLVNLAGQFLIDQKSIDSAVDTITSLAIGLGKIIVVLAVAAGAITLLGLLAPKLLLAAPLMGAGAIALGALTGGLLLLGGVLIGMVKLASMIGIDKQNAEWAAETISSVVMASGTIAASVVLGAYALEALGALAAFALIGIPLMWIGAWAIGKLTPAIMSMSAKIIEIATSAANMQVNPIVVSKAVDNITTMIGSTVKLVDAIKTFGGSLSLGGLIMLIPKMKLASFAFKKITPSMEAYIDSIIQFGKNLAGKVNKNVVDQFSKVIGQVGNVVGTTANLLNAMVTKLVPLTEGSGWFGMGKSIIQKLDDSKGQILEFIPKVVEFANSLVMALATGNVNASLLTSGTQTLAALGNLLVSAGSAISTMADKLLPFTQGSGSWGWGPSQITQLIKNKQALIDGLTAVVGFAKDGIITPTKEIKDVKGLQDARNIMDNMSAAIVGVTTTIEAMAKTFGYLNDGGYIWGKNTVDKIMANKVEFQKKFTAMLIFIRDGLVNPIRSVIHDTETLKKIGPQITEISNIMTGVQTMLDGLVGLMNNFQVQEGSNKSVMEYIEKYRNHFQEYFKVFVQMIEEGIVNSVLGKMDMESLQQAGRVITDVNKVLAGVVPIIENMAKILGVTADTKALTGDAPITKIFNAKGEFEKYFRAVAEMLRDGVFKPVEDVFTGLDFNKAVSLINGMNSVVSKLMPILTNTSKLVGMMASDGEIITDAAALNQIDAKSTAFKEMFTRVAKFLNEGVVKPVINEFTNTKDISKASQILGSIGSIVGRLPKLLDDVSNKLLPLAGAGPAEGDFGPTDFDTKAAAFKDFFTKVIKFVSEIIEPFKNSQIDTKSMSKIVSQLSMTSSIISKIGDVVSKTINALKPLLENEALDLTMYESPLAMVGDFISQGVIDPIEIMPDSTTLESSMVKLQEIQLSLRGISASAKDIISHVLSMPGLDLGGEFGKTPIGYLAEYLSEKFLVDLYSMPSLTSFLFGMFKTSVISSVLKDIKSNLDESVATIMELPGHEFAGLSMSDSPVNSLAEYLDFGVVLPIRFMPEPEQFINGYFKISENLSALRMIENAMWKTTGTLLFMPGKELDNSGDSAFFSLQRYLHDQVYEPITDITMSAELNQSLQQLVEIYDTLDMIEVMMRGIGDKLMGMPGIGALVGGFAGMLKLPEMALGGLMDMPGKLMGGLMDMPGKLMGGLMDMPSKLMGGVGEMLELPGAAIGGLMDMPGKILGAPGELEFLPDTDKVLGSHAGLSGIGSLFGFGGADVQPTNMAAMPAESPDAIRQKIAARVIGEEPATNNVTSEELTNIASESEEQTELQRKLVDLFTKVLDALKPQTSPTTSTGGIFGDTSPNQLASKPAKYFRNPLGAVAQLPSKASTNLGVPRV